MRPLSPASKGASQQQLGCQVCEDDPICLFACTFSGTVTHWPGAGAPPSLLLLYMHACDCCLLWSCHFQPIIIVCVVCVQVQRCPDCRRTIRGGGNMLRHIAACKGRASGQYVIVFFVFLTLLIFFSRPRVVSSRTILFDCIFF